MIDGDFNYEEARTLTGFTLKQVEEKFKAVLPASAYSAVPGGADLTDIEPTYLYEALTECFGICGVGWSYRYDDISYTDTGITTGKEKYSRYLTLIPCLKLVYHIKCGNKTYEMAISAPGSSTSESLSYAGKGAITNALSSCASRMLWQLGVYRGEISHRNVPRERKSEPAGSDTMSKENVAVIYKLASACGYDLLNPPTRDKLLVELSIEPAQISSLAVATGRILWSFFKYIEKKEGEELKSSTVVGKDVARIAMSKNIPWDSALEAYQKELTEAATSE